MKMSTFKRNGLESSQKLDQIKLNQMKNNQFQTMI